MGVLTFKIWRIVKLGGLEDADAIRKAIKALEYEIDSWADRILNRIAFKVSREETEVALVLLSVAELGFKNGKKLSRVYERALKFGLKLCPSDLGPRLRSQYTNQKKGECVKIAMEPIADSDCHLSRFDVVHDNSGCRLSAGNGRPDYFCGRDDRFVFVLPRPAISSCSVGNSTQQQVPVSRGFFSRFTDSFGF